MNVAPKPLMNFKLAYHPNWTDFTQQANGHIWKNKMNYLSLTNYNGSKSAQQCEKNLFAFYYIYCILVAMSII